MEVVIQSDALAATRLAGRLIASLVRQKPRAVLGLCTGRTPVALYAELVRLHTEEGLDFGGVTTFNLDEYIGIGPDHPGSFHAFMEEHLFAHVNIAPECRYLPDGLAKDMPGFCLSYEAAIRAAGGIDLQVLGIGHDGHIGFNEPSSSLASRTRIKTLAPDTRRRNADSFGGEARVPRHVVTMGIGTILEARRCLLLAFGDAKADAAARMIEGPITAMVPASSLQLHPNAIIMLDEAAASRLTLAEYYRWVYDNKPGWQRW